MTYTVRILRDGHHVDMGTALTRERADRLFDVTVAILRDSLDTEIEATAQMLDEAQFLDVVAETTVPVSTEPLPDGEWVQMTDAQTQAWLNGYFAPHHVEERADGVYYR